MHPRVASLAAELGISLAALSARGLAEQPEAQGLELAERGADGREHLLVPPAAHAWRAMQASAAQAGITLTIVSAFRSVERQAELVRRKLEAGQCIAEILAVTAAPGYSEHHTGRAVDIATPGVPVLTEDFERTPAFAWLRQHAGEFGFRLSFPRGNAQGYCYEPWHWCYAAA